MTGARIQLVVGARPSLVTVESAGPVRWRLLGANNRSLAWSAVGFPDEAAALAALQTFRADLPSRVAAVTNLAGQRWAWPVRTELSAGAVSARDYSRRAECERNLARAIEQLPGATLVEVVLSVRAPPPAPGPERA